MSLLKNNGVYSPGYYALIVLVMLLWALCFPLISVGLQTVTPMTFAALRAFIAGIGLLIPALMFQHSLPHDRRTWLTLAGVGLGSTTLGFGGMFVAGGVINPGIATVLANSQPLIAAMLAYVSFEESVQRHHRVGLIGGFTGIVITALPQFGGGGLDNHLIGLGAILLSSIGVAVGNVLMKRLSIHSNLLTATGVQFIIGGVPLLVIALIVESPGDTVLSFSFVIDLLTLSLAGTSLAFFLWFSLLHRGNLNRLNSFTFLTPVFALLIGTMFFDERLHWLEIVGVIVIIGSTLWVGGTKQQTL